MTTQKINASLDNTVTNLRSEMPSRALLAGAQTWWSAVAESQQEVAHFISDRLAKDGEAIRDTLTSRNWSDALAVQARWLDETMRDYNAEMTKLTKFYTEAAASAVRKENQAA